MHLHQLLILKMEHRSGMCVGTLREYVQALGGSWEIFALVPHEAIKIFNFDEQMVLHASEEATAEMTRPSRVDLRYPSCADEGRAPLSALLFIIEMTNRFKASSLFYPKNVILGIT